MCYTLPLCDHDGCPPTECLKITNERLNQSLEILWGTLVMLKRGFDKHETKEGFLELQEADWIEAVRRAHLVFPER